MARSKNCVLAGDYQGKDILCTFGVVTIMTSFSKGIDLNKNTVAEYELLDETSKKSVTSAVGRAFVGGVLLGPVGWLAGITAKSKGTHIVAIQFKDGKKSLIQINDKTYKALLTKIF